MILLVVCGKMFVIVSAKANPSNGMKFSPVLENALGGVNVYYIKNFVVNVVRNVKIFKKT